MRNIRVSRIADRVTDSESSKFSKESETESRVSNRRSNDLNANTFNINLLERVIRGGLEDYIVVQSSIARSSFEILVNRSILLHARIKGYWKRLRFKIYR